LSVRIRFLCLLFPALVLAGCGDEKPGRGGAALNPDRILVERYSHGGARGALSLYAEQRRQEVQAVFDQYSAPLEEARNRVQGAQQKLDDDAQAGAGAAGPPGLSPAEQAALREELKQLQASESRIRAELAGQLSRLSEELGLLQALQNRLENRDAAFWKVLSHRLDPVDPKSPDGMRTSTIEVAVSEYKDLLGTRPLTFRLTWKAVEHRNSPTGPGRSNWELRRAKLLGSPETPGAKAEAE
jgi:hypothetical protein